MKGEAFEKLQEWQRRGTGRRVDITLDYRAWAPDKFVERIAVFDGGSGLFGADIEPADIDRIDEVLRDKAAQTARDAIAANYAILLRCKGNELRETDTPE